MKEEVVVSALFDLFFPGRGGGGEKSEVGVVHFFENRGGEGYLRGGGGKRHWGTRLSCFSRFSSQILKWLTVWGASPSEWTWKRPRISRNQEGWFKKSQGRREVRENIRSIRSSRWNTVDESPQNRQTGSGRGGFPLGASRGVPAQWCSLPCKVTGIPWAGSPNEPGHLTNRFLRGVRLLFGQESCRTKVTQILEFSSRIKHWISLRILPESFEDFLCFSFLRSGHHWKFTKENPPFFNVKSQTNP